MQDGYIRRILSSCKTIAVIGASANWNRPSYFAMSYMQVYPDHIIDNRSSFPRPSSCMLLSHNSFFTIHYWGDSLRSMLSNPIRMLCA
jgi:hypothetical protein